MTNSVDDNRYPFYELIGINITEVGEGTARGTLDFDMNLSSNPNSAIAHGAVTMALADAVSVAAVQSYEPGAKPTIDFRIDYLSPATGDLLADAEVLRYGDTTAMTRADVYLDDGTETHVATGNGTYKATDDSSDSLWSTGRNRSAEDP